MSQEEAHVAERTLHAAASRWGLAKAPNGFRFRHSRAESR